MSRSRVPLLLVVLVGTTLYCGPRIVAPVEQTSFTSLTSAETLSGFLRSIQAPPFISVVRLAVTRQGRDVNTVRVTTSNAFGADSGKLRVLLFAQQHGDEPSGKEALTLLLARIASHELDTLLARLDLIIVPQMNPDGAEAGRRLTSDNLDLNRDHVLLSSPETKGLHDEYARWLPHVTLDIHEYSSFSRSWSDSGFIKAGDVQLGMLTNLNTSPRIREIQHTRVFPSISGRMLASEYSFHEYIVGSPGTRIRHSTTDINDGRQSFGILGSLSFIQEGRKWKTPEDQLRRRALSQLASAMALLEYSSSNASELLSLVNAERQYLATMAGREMVLQMEHRTSNTKLSIPVQLAVTSRDTSWLVRPYHGKVQALRTTTMPQAYLIPRENREVSDLLSRHHIQCDTAREAKSIVTGLYAVHSVQATRLEEDTLRIPGVSTVSVSGVLRPGDIVVHTSSLHSLFIATLLEPESMWSLLRYKQFSSLLMTGEFSIKRILVR